MGSVKVAAISLPRETRRFVQTWFSIYEDDPHWVPPLFIERKRFFDPAKNPYFKHARVAYFIATRDGRDVGTIAATIDAVYQQEEPGTAFFGFFEFVNDVEVAAALLGAAREWLADQGMHKLLGPFNFNTNHEFGLLVDGFDSDPLVANPHNSAYYPEIYEALGLRPAMDWYAYNVDATHERFDKMLRVAERLMSRHPEIHIRPLNLSDFDEEVERVRAIYVDAWEQNWGHVRVSDEEFDFIAQSLKQIIDPELCFVAETEDRVVAISITLPDFNQVVKKMNGRVFPFGWRHLLMKKRIIDRLRVFMLGVAHDFQSLPLGAALYAETFRVVRAKGFPGGDASLILENNVRMRGALEKMGGTIEKTYRNYEIAIGAPPSGGA
ncbi:MAG: N-acetyltransferase [Myxococcota bacterium]|nr:N-acetyltransferase [Myxococcota bacterium]